MLDAKQCMGCAHEGLIVTNMDGVILETTPAAEHILEMPSLDLKSRNIRDFCGSLDTYTDLREKASNEAKALNRSMSITTGMGKRKLVNMSIQRVDQEGGGRFVHIFQDCEDLKDMEQRLLQAERLATIGRFASQIAHEIRNPLNSISLNVELLSDEFSDTNSEAHGLIRSVLRELDRLNGIVSEYLQFSRFPKPNLTRGRVDRVIRNVVENFKPPARIKFRVSLVESTPDVWLDEHLLRQVLDNLTRNAVEAIDGEGTIEIEDCVVDRFVVIRVKDSGKGIPADVQSRIFEPFFTTKSRGTGLGLATSQQILFEHNGHLVFESQPGHGTTFSLLLPI